MNEEIPMILEREAGAPEQVNPIAVGFGLMPEQDGAASAKAGHPVFRDVEYCKKAVPGNRQSIALQPATEQDKLRFPKAYAAFKERAAKPVTGLPVEEWPIITRSQAMTLRAMHIHTVESLAEVSEANVGSLGQGGRELIAKAKAYVKQAAEGAVVAQLAAEKQQLLDVITGLQAQLADLSGRVGEQEKRGPGRPRKQPDAEAA
jgi:hypothetical protein